MNKSPAEKKPELLWHYTNWAGLNGILKAGKLWASHISYLNDSNELRHAVKLFQSVVDEQFADPLVLSWENDIQDQLNNSEGLDVCVTSFSKDGDDLSQWRGYANPSPGFALGFDKSVLEGIAKAAKSRLVACEYDRRKQTERLRAIVRSFWTKYQAQPGDEKRAKVLPSLKWKLLQDFASLAPEFKSASFARENEWRLISEPSEWKANIDFHVSQTLVVPHHEVPFKKEKVRALVAIKIGPNAHMKLAHKSIAMLAKARDFPDVEILGSKVPFRNW